MRVLVVEDEPTIARTLQRGLRGRSITADVAATGETALELMSVTPYEVVVLDRDLPGISGDDVCRIVVTDHPAAKVLMLTASAGVRDRVAGLSLGADDYLPKPFDFDELVARIHALGRRTAPAREPCLQTATVRLDPVNHTVTRFGLTVRLTPKEFEVLHALMRADGAIVSAEELLDQAWDIHADSFTQSMRVIIARLRKKLGEPEVIETVARFGYRVVTDA